MSVYVDDPIWPFGRMMMCHMVADTSAELHAMAEAIGVRHGWVQHPGTPREHFDICKSKRALAVAEGAKEITPREYAERVDAKIRAARETPGGGR